MTTTRVHASRRRDVMPPAAGLVALAVAALAACAPGERDATAASEGERLATASGPLVIIGGALQADNADVYRAVLDGRAGAGPVCVIPTASGDPEASMASAVERIDAHGGPGTARGVLLSTDDPGRARDPAVAEELSACAGFFFTGGAQSRIVDVFLPEGDTTQAYRALVDRWRDGAVVAGTSAGAAMMSRVMISGGGSDEAVATGVAAGPDADGVQIRPGMGFVEPLLDQHFLARGRIGRLLVAAGQPDLPDVGLGIDENTALLVRGDSATVLGASGVVVVDARAAERPAPDRATGITVTLAGAGDVVDLDTWTVRVAPGKAPLAADAGPVDVPEDPFERWAFLHLVADLAASADTAATVSLPATSLRVVESAGFTASSLGTADGVEGTPRGLSAGPFRVDLLPR